MMPKVVRGEIVSADEVDAMPKERRFHWADTLPHLRILDRLAETETGLAGATSPDEIRKLNYTLADLRSEHHALTQKIAVRMDEVTYECPEGSDITDRVVSACSAGSAGKVVVECMHKTWARYACQG